MLDQAFGAAVTLLVALLAPGGVILALVTRRKPKPEPVEPEALSAQLKRLNEQFDIVFDMYSEERAENTRMRASIASHMVGCEVVQAVAYEHAPATPRPTPLG